MGASIPIDYAVYLGRTVPDNIVKNYDHFTIEISIVLRKPKEHYSRAPGVIWDILNTFDGGTFFQGQGYWRGVQEPVIYIMISTRGAAGEVIEKLSKLLKNGQEKLKQQEMYVKINGCTFVGNLLSEDRIKTFPKQMEFDEDVKIITANKSRADEDYRLIFGRVNLERGKQLVKETQKKYNNAKEKGDEGVIIEAEKERKTAKKDAEEYYKKSYDIWSSLEHELINKTDEAENRRDLLKCYSNALDPVIRKFLNDEQKIRTCESLIWLLPLGKESNYGDLISKHAEARIRGNRINIFHNLKLNLASDSELFRDGVFAFSQIVEFINPKAKNKPYLDRDPIIDLKNIITQIKKLDTKFNLQTEIKNQTDKLSRLFPYYKDEIEDLLEHVLRDEVSGEK